MISGFESKSFEERLKELGMFSVERRFLIEDMIKVHKIFVSDSNTENKKYFIVIHGRETTGHDKNIKKNHAISIKEYTL